MDEPKGISDDDIADVLLTVHGEDSCGCHRCARALLSLAEERAIESVLRSHDEGCPGDALVAARLRMSLRALSPEKPRP